MKRNKQIKILWVDDEIELLKSFVFFLEERNYDVDTCNNGNDAIEKVLENKYYVDEAYDTLIVNPIQKTSSNFLWKIFDIKIIDGAVNGIAKYISNISFDWRKLQTGVIQDYTTISVAGVIIIIVYLLLPIFYA